MDSYYKHKIKMVILALVFFGAFNTASTVFGFNVIEKINNHIKIDKILAILILISIIYLAGKKTAWLPFLGETVFPKQLVPLKIINGNTSITVNVKPNTKVAYWAATPNDDENRNVLDAYGDYNNSGVVLSDNNGVATLIFDKGTGYNVPGNRHINSHVHYRELSGEWGMIGPVKTIFI